MIYVLGQFAPFVALAFLVGAVIGWTSFARPGDRRLGWLTTGLIALGLGLVVALLKLLPGVAGLALEIAIWLFAGYLIGCLLGSFLRALMGGEVEARAPAAALAGAGAAAAAKSGAPSPSSQRADAKARQKAEAEARSKAKFAEEEAARAKAEAERLAKEQAEAEAKAKREAELAAREEELARAGVSVRPAREFSVAKGDELTWIGAIGPYTESRLNEFGVRKFAQIAAWTPSNGRWIDEQLGAPGRVEKEDWIGQAKRLLAGQDTDHSRGVKAGRIRIDDAPPPPPKPEPAVAAAKDAGGRLADKAAEATGAVKAGLAAAAASALGAAAAKEVGGEVRDKAAASAQSLGHEIAETTSAAKNALDDKLTATQDADTPKPPAARIGTPNSWPAVTPRPEPGHGGLVPEPHVAVPAPTPVFTPSNDGRPPRDDGAGPADDLKWLLGVGPANERALNELGVRRFAQIATWTDENARWVGRHMRFPGRIERERWIEQAKLLAAGLDTEHSRAVKAGTVDLARADAIVDEREANAFAASLPQLAARVENEDAYEGARPLGLAGARGGKPDDLKLIRGIGKQNEERLHNLGVWHFDQIAAWSAENVKWVGSYLAFPGRIDREEWIKQAAVLAKGEMTDFAKRVEAGDVPTSQS
jgi:predicted flap endonuclease-1-like 5' DNA nuclease